MKLKNTIRFKVVLFDNQQGEVWEQEYIKPILLYKKYYCPLTGSFSSQSDSPSGAYDLFSDEVLNTWKTYASEENTDTQSVRSKFMNDGNCYVSVFYPSDNTNYKDTTDEDWKTFDFWKRDSTGEKTDEDYNEIKIDLVKKISQLITTITPEQKIHLKESA